MCHVTPSRFFVYDEHQMSIAKKDRENKTNMTEICPNEK